MTMKRLFVFAIALPGAIAIWLSTPLFPTTAHAQGVAVSSGGCTSNCTFAGTTTVGAITTGSISSTSSSNTIGSPSVPFNYVVFGNSGGILHTNTNFAWQMTTNNGGAVRYRGGTSNSGTSIAHMFGPNATDLTAAGAKIASWYNDNSFATEIAYLDQAGTTATKQLKVTATTGGGTITLSAGSGTATVLSGHRCVCSDTTALALCKPSVSGTTLTITGTGTDVIAYLCF
jgi:hypothetical protein